MLPATLIKGFDAKRLKMLLGIFFLALAVPTGVLIWQAYSQLKWEAFHQYRGMAEELTGRIDAGINDLVANAEGRSFADYSFLVVTGEGDTNFTRPSPLSAYPVVGELPGTVGYFQVDSEGAFRTPLLPQNQSEAEAFGIDATEYETRQELASEIQSILSDNQLVQVRLGEKASRERVVQSVVVAGGRAGEEQPAPAALSPRNEESVPAEKEDDRLDGNASLATDAFSDADSGMFEAEAEMEQLQTTAAYNQSIFDQLNAPASAPAPSAAADRAYPDVVPTMEAADPDVRQNSLGKVRDLKLDEELEKKSEAIEETRRQVKDEPSDNQAAGKQVARTKRVEQDAIAEVVVDDVRISTFESEIDPFEFSLLDSGHFVMFRNVWRDGDRFIQGLLVNQRAFINDVVEREFMGTALSQMSNLIVAFQDDVIHTANGSAGRSYTSRADAMQGDLLYRGRLSAPMDNIGLIFSINNLPAGPGGNILAWVTLVLAVVFLSGFYAIYRLGLGQITLARQQQDFVSAVSHELKTPLTSIRMYGEMLKDGWADQKKQQQYYEYIHDESERLTRLISNVLQLASITRNEPQLDVKPVRVATLLNQIESKISHQVQRAGFELQLEQDPGTETAEIDIDDDCFAQIIINLVDNAIKFSKDATNKSIEVSARLNKNDRIVFSVRDHGPGIPKNQMKKIFKLFYRSESELTRETVGTGIGLAIVHQLTQAMGGSVDVVNREPGAEFQVSFPVHA